MAVDLVAAPGEARPKKRPRLGWDVPGPVLPEEAALLQLQLASQLFRAELDLYALQRSQGNVAVRNQSDRNEYHYLPAKSCAVSPPWRKDDKDGHLNFEIGDTLTSRYKIIRKMGEGTFGRVLECRDLETQELVAVKVVRSAKKYRDAAMIEVDVLHEINGKDKSGSRHCVQIRSWFDYRNHICIVFEKLGPSLYDFLRINNYRPFSVDLVRDFGRQLLESVAYMHKLKLIHTDLKPENILLVSSEYTEVTDYKGETLFQTHQNIEHLAMMERVLGLIPSHIVKRSMHRSEKYFRNGRALNWPEGASSKESVRVVRRLPRLKNLVMQHADHSAGLLIDLLEQLLTYDPSKRLTAEEALRHPFFRNSRR